VGPIAPSGSLWNGDIAGSFGGGSGSLGDPYLINTGEQLAYLAAQANGGTDYNGAYFELTADLDLNGDTHEWTAIGTNTNPFKGNFDGADHVIYRLTIDELTAYYQGLFGYLSGAQVKDLGLASLNIKGKEYVGGVAGQVGYGSSIENSYSTGVVRGNRYIGGVAGYVSDRSSIENSYSTGAVSGTNKVGGVVGFVYGNGTIQYCAALNPSVKATGITAGWVGRVVGEINWDATANDNVAWDGMGTGGGEPFNTNPGNAGTGKTDEELATSGTYTALTWNFTLFWTMRPGNETYTALPILKWQ
jgi:hypothetical protein